MKKNSLLFIVLFIFCLNVKGQWVSPGDGSTFTMQDLVTASNGAVISVATDSFSIVQDITISENDVLSLTDDVTSISVDDVSVIVKR